MWRMGTGGPGAGTEKTSGRPPRVSERLLRNRLTDNCKPLSGGVGLLTDLVLPVLIGVFAFSRFEKVAGFHFRNERTLPDCSVYAACTSLGRIRCFWRFSRLMESTTYAFSRPLLVRSPPPRSYHFPERDIAVSEGLVLPF
jgi:hypothetical protein